MRQGFSGDAYGLVEEPSGLVVNPAGTHAVYSVRKMDPDKDRYFTYLYLADVEKRTVMPLTGSGSESFPLWLDESRLLFASRREASGGEETVYYCLDIRGGEALPYMRVPAAGAKVTALGDDRYLVLAERDLRKEEDYSDQWEYWDEYPYIGDGGAPMNRRRTTVFLYDRASNEMKPLTERDTQVGRCPFGEDLVPFDKGFYYTGHTYKKDYENLTGIYYYSFTFGESHLLHEFRGSIYGMRLFGDRLYLSLFCVTGPRNGMSVPVSLALDGSDAREYDPDLEVQYGLPAEDGLYFAKIAEAVTSLYVLRKDGSAAFLDTAGVEPSSLGVCRDGLLVIGHEAWKPSEVYLRTADGSMELLSHHGEGLIKRGLTAGEELTAEYDGHKVYGFVMKPHAYEPGRKYPAVVNIHGGPHGYFARSVHYDNQYFSAEGYFVILCNPTGSVSYGADYANITGRMGELDLKEVLAFTDAALKAYPDINPDALAVTGQSYGGYLANMMIGKTDRFKAAVPRMGISNWLSMEGTAIENRYGEGCTGGDPWNALMQLWDQSPLKYVKNVKTPTLIIHHEKDQCVPFEQAEQMFTALCMLGVPSRFLVNKNCGHGGRSVSQLIHDMEAILAWFEKYLGSIPVIQK